jgi:hypothetical protein
MENPGHSHDAVTTGSGASLSKETPPTESRPAPGELVQSTGVIDELSGAFDSARATLYDFLELISLEMRHAGLALIWMLALGVAAIFCVLSAWLGLMGVIVLLAMSLGMHPIDAIMAMAGLNLLAGIFAGLWIYSYQPWPAVYCHAQAAGR